jgi:hypothetical protein
VVEVDGRRLRGARISLSFELVRGDPKAFSAHHRFTMTDAQGRFRLCALAPGRYTVLVVHLNVHLRGLVDVVSGETTKLRPGY